MAADADCTKEKTHWSSYEAQVLLTLWADSSIQQELESTVRNERVYSRITSELAAVGIHRSIKQCREKIKKLKQQYKKFKDQNRKIDAEWYVTMDSVLGHRPGANFECDVTYYDPDTGMGNDVQFENEAQIGSDRALVGTVPSVQNGYRRTVHQAMKRWSNQRRRMLLRAKQSALRRRALQGRHGSSLATSARWESQARRDFQALPQSDEEMGEILHHSPVPESHEENTRDRKHIKTETEESVVDQQRTGSAPISVGPVRMRYEESQSHSTTQEAAAITVQQDLLAAQQEQCRLMAENNSIQRTLVRAVTHSNRCISDLAKSIRAQTAVTASVQERIVQLLERQEWTNQLLTMKVMGVSSTLSQHPQQARGGSALPSAGPSSAYSSGLSGKEATELFTASTVTDQ